MGCLSDTSKLCTLLALIAINAVLLAGGLVVLFASLHAKNSGWVDAIGTYWGSADDVLTALQITGYAIIALSALGSIAACLRWRVGLLLYAFVVFLLLIGFVVIAIIAFSARHTSESWKSQDYPADDAEPTVKAEFDRAYCYAQGAFICNDMGVSEAAAVFYPDFANSSLLSSFTDLKGINAMCDAFLSIVPVLSTACKGCEAARQFENFTSVLEWADEECPRTGSTLLWCGNYLATSNDTLVTVGTAPYAQCRSEFLGLVSSSTLRLGVGSVIICVAALLVVIFSCYLRTKERKEQQYEDVEQSGTPHTHQPFYGGQPTQQPITSKV